MHRNFYSVIFNSVGLPNLFCSRKVLQLQSSKFARLQSQRQRRQGSLALRNPYFQMILLLLGMNARSKNTFFRLSVHLKSERRRQNLPSVSA